MAYPSDPVRGPRAPIAVDFTHFGKSTSAQPARPLPPSEPSSPSTPANPRKRSFSQANTQPGACDTENIDPSLNNAPVANMAAPPEVAESRSKEQRKAELEKEMARMREMLMAKEREIAELG